MEFLTNLKKRAEQERKLECINQGSCFHFACPYKVLSHVVLLQLETTRVDISFVNAIYKLKTSLPIADRQFVRKSETKTKIGRFQQMHINRSMVNGQGKILFQEMTRDFILKFISMYFQTCIIQISLLSINLSIFYVFVSPI